MLIPLAVKSYARLLEVFPLNVPVTPEEIDKAANVQSRKGGPIGRYSSLQVCQLKRIGFEFTVQKDGRHVVSYTLVKEPPNGAAYRAGTVDPSEVRLIPLAPQRGTREVFLSTKNLTANPIPTPEPNPVNEIVLDNQGYTTLTEADLFAMADEAPALEREESEIESVQEAAAVTSPSEARTMEALREIMDVASDIKAHPEKVRSVMTASSLRDLQKAKGKLGIAV